jgi:methyl-accepting chemotaxis protein
VTRLVKPVVTAVKETLRAPEAFANADLTARTEGALQGAFEGVRDSADAVTDRLAARIGRVKELAVDAATSIAALAQEGGAIARRMPKTRPRRCSEPPPR